MRLCCSNGGSIWILGWRSTRARGILGGCCEHGRGQKRGSGYDVSVGIENLYRSEALIGRLGQYDL